MWTSENEFIVRCHCGEYSHLMQVYFDVEDNDTLPMAMWISFRNGRVDSFWQRFKQVYYYLFKKKQCQFLSNHEIFFDLDGDEGRKELDDLTSFLIGVLSKSVLKAEGLDK